jgi:transposase
MRTLGEALQVSSCCTKSSGEPKNGHRSQARTLIQSLDESAFSETAPTREGYRVVEVEGHYAGLKQRWTVVESDNHAEGDLNQLEKRLDRECKEAERALKALGKRLFGCERDASEATQKLAKVLRYHRLENITIEAAPYHRRPGRPRKDVTPQCNYRVVQAKLVCDEAQVRRAKHKAGRFVLATNDQRDGRRSASRRGGPADLPGPAGG